MRWYNQCNLFKYEYFLSLGVHACINPGVGDKNNKRNIHAGNLSKRLPGLNYIIRVNSIILNEIIEDGPVKKWTAMHKYESKSMCPINGIS